MMKKEITYNRVCYLIIDKENKESVLKEYFFKYGKSIKIIKVDDFYLKEKLNCVNKLLYKII